MNKPVLAKHTKSFNLSLSNAFTSAFKKIDPVPQFKATAKLGRFLAQLPHQLVISASILRGGGDHSFFLPRLCLLPKTKVSQGVIMFKELQPLLAKRSLTITVAALNGEEIRVNVIPHSRPEDTKVNEQIKYSLKDEVAAIPDAAIKALTTPISLTGTAEEIDAKLSDVLLQFVESHGHLQASFDRACSEISDAVRAIHERNKNKPKAKTTGAKTEQKEDSKPKPEAGKPKAEETLPLWWTDKSVAPPGIVAPRSTSSPAAPANGSETNSQSTNAQEVGSPCH